MKVMSIRLPEELYAKLEAQAEAVGVAPAVLVRVYLKDLIEKRHYGAGIVEGIVDRELDE